jgi:cyanophycin synthetase
MSMIVKQTNDPEQAWETPTASFPESFRTWRSSVIRSGKLPIIGVAGLRGKTAVIQLVDHILTTAGHRTALWTSNGVEIGGIRQESELGAWQEVVRNLVDGTVSVALQELDAATVLATGLPNDFYPLLSITNICWNDELCQLHREGQLAIKAMPRILEAVSGSGALVANGEDFTLFDAIRSARPVPTVYFALNRNVPLIRQHVALGGIATWRDGSVIRSGRDEDAPAISCTPELPYTLSGGASFQISNVLAASSLALLMGIKPADIERGLLSYDPDPEKSPGTMAVLRKNGFTVIIDRTDPSWFMRPVLRGIRAVSKGRLFVVTGRMNSVPMGDVPEVGRMLGRDADALILYDHESDPSQTDSLMQGARRVLDPPLVARYPSKHRAIEAALRRMREGDYLLILTSEPADALASVRAADHIDVIDSELTDAALERL